MPVQYVTANQLEKAIKENVSTQEIANTVNKAIQEGKITIPSELPILSVAFSSLVSEEELKKNFEWEIHINRCKWRRYRILLSYYLWR